MATSIKIKTLPGARRSRSIELNPDGLTKGVKRWEASTSPAGGGRHTNYYGQERGEVSRYNRRMVLKGMRITQEDWHHIESWRDQGEPLSISPLWPEDTTVTVLPLGKPAPGEDPLQDFLISEKRSAVDFTRYSTRFHPVTGLPAPFHVPLYTDGWQGEQINVGDVINDEHFPSFEYRAYTDRDAADVGAITRFYLDPRFDVDVFWTTQFVMVQTKELDTNVFALAMVNAINSAGNYIDLETTDGGSALADVADFTHANRTSISNNLVADGDMSDSRTGSWADNGGADLIEKSKTENETGIQSLRVVGGGAAQGTLQELGDVPPDTEMVIWARISATMGRLLANGPVDLQIYNVDDAVNELTETPALVAFDTYTWFRYSVTIAAGGAGQKTIQLHVEQPDGDLAEWNVDRIEIYQSTVVNGGMEGDADGVYDGEDIVTTSNAATTTYAGVVCTDAAAWNLAQAKVGMYALESGGAYGRIVGVNDGADTVTVDAWENGPPVNGNDLEVRYAVAAGWGNSGCDVAADQLWQEVADTHGGSSAQGAIVDATSEGIITATNVFATDEWYLVGGHFKVASGDIVMKESVSGTTIVDGMSNATAAAYTFFARPFQAGGNRQMFIRTLGGGGEWLSDDIFAVRLPHLTTDGGPFDDAVYDLPEVLDPTTGFTVFGSWTPDVANTDTATLGVAAYFADISRHIFDVNYHIAVVWVTGLNAFRLQVVDAGGVVNTATVATTFSAGDKTYWAAKCGANPNGASKAWFKVGTAAPVTGTGANNTIPSGASRAWLRYGVDFTRPAHGSEGGITIINEALSDSDIEAILEIMAGDTGYEADLTLLNETYGIIYEIEPNGIRTWDTSGEHVTCDIALREVGRIGAFSNAY